MSGEQRSECRKCGAVFTKTATDRETICPKCSERRRKDINAASAILAIVILIFVIGSIVIWVRVVGFGGP